MPDTIAVAATARSRRGNCRGVRRNAAGGSFDLPTRSRGGEHGSDASNLVAS
jgi:hypothetical protein